MGQAIWTQEQKEYLVENYNKLDAKILSETLGKTVKSVMEKARKMGLSKKVKWTEQDDEILRNNYIKIPTEELAVILNRTVNAIHCHAISLGINRTSRFWTEEENEYLKEKWGLSSIKTIAANLNRTERAVLSHANEVLGLREQIIGNGEFLTSRDISEMLGVDIRSVNKWVSEGILKGRRFKLKDRYRHQIRSNDLLLFIENHQHLWDTKKADLSLLENYFVSPITFKIKHPDWYLTKIQQDAKKVQRVRKPWSVKEEKILLSLYRQGITTRNIAKQLNRTFYSVKRRIQRLNHPTEISA